METKTLLFSRRENYIMKDVRTKSELLETMEKLNKQNKENMERKEEALIFFNTAVEIGNKIFCCIPVKLLRIDHEMYQRPLQKSFKYLLNNWDNNKCDPVVVNYRSDGCFYVINEQHRTIVAEMLGIKQIVCDVFVGLTLKEEAEMFVGQYDGTTKLNPVDSYRANIIRGEEVDTLIKGVCDKYGVSVAHDKAPKVLGSLTVVRNIVKPSVTNSGGKSSDAKENVKIVDWIFDIFKRSGWEDYKDTYNADMMQSLWYVWRNNQDILTIAKRKLVEFFEGSSPKEIKALGNIKYPDCGHGGGIYRVMMDIINESDNITQEIEESSKVVNMPA